MFMMSGRTLTRSGHRERRSVGEPGESPAFLRRISMDFFIIFEIGRFGY